MRARSPHAMPRAPLRWPLLMCSALLAAALPGAELRAQEGSDGGSNAPGVETDTRTAGQGSSFGPSPFGPLRTSERNPLYHLFLTPVVRGADVEARGSTWIQLANAYSNIFEYNVSPLVRQRFDLERLSTTLTVVHGLLPGLEVGVQVGVQHNWSGFLDPLIQGVHTTFGLPNADREKVPNNRYLVRLTGAQLDGPVYLDLPPGTALEAPRVLAGWRVLGGPRSAHALTLRGVVKLPMGDLPASTGRSDAAVLVASRHSWRRLNLHLSAGGVVLDPTPELEPIVRSSALLASAGLEVMVSPAFSLLAQFSGGTRYTRGAGFPELDRPPVNFGVGAAGEWSGWGWQVSFSEDLPPNTPSVDFTFDLQLSRRWPERRRRLTPGAGPRREEGTGDGS